MDTQRDGGSGRVHWLASLMLGLGVLGLGVLAGCGDDGSGDTPAGPGCTLTASGAVSFSAPCDAWLEPGMQAGTYEARVFALGDTNFTFGVTGIGSLQKQTLRFPTLALNQYASAALVESGSSAGWIMSTQTPMIGFFEFALDGSDPAVGEKWAFRGDLDVRLDASQNAATPSVRVHVTMR